LSSIAISAAFLPLFQTPAGAQPLRVVGTDVSYWNIGNNGANGISQSSWNTAYSSGNLRFAQLRATRGGTTGTSPSGGTSRPATLSERYDDPTFVQNLIRATAAGLHVGAYHFGRPDLLSNSPVDEANHFIQMAGAWLRPGYVMPMFDLEAGIGNNTGDQLAQFSIDFSDRLFQVMQIRPCIYINGQYSSPLSAANQARRDALAKPASLTPSVVSPAYPMLWNARYSDNGNPGAIPIQTGSPKSTYTTVSAYYGPWDDYGDPAPWSFWQYSSTVAFPGFPDTTCDADVSHGDIEYVRNYLIPAVWWNNSSGDWSTLANWNSGQTPVAPATPSDQPQPFATGGLPTPRLPGAAGTGPTSGQYDTVILERPSADIVVTLSTGTHNIRKLYMRETLNITGGSLTVNYNPAYRANDSSDVRHGGPVSAQFSGPVTLSGSGNLSLHTLQVDASRAFTLTSGKLTFDTINLMPHSSTPARLVVNGSPTLTPRNNVTAEISKGSGSGSSGVLDLAGGSQILNVDNGGADVDVALNVPISNGGFTKAGAGTLALNAASTFAGGATVSSGRLLVNNTSGSGTGTGAVTVNSGGVLGGAGRISGAVSVASGGVLAPGNSASMGTLTLLSAPTFNGTNVHRINRNGGTPLSDKISLTTGTLAYGGTLVVSNTGSAFVGGDQVSLYSATAYSGSFTSAILPPLTADLNWYMGNLAVNGSIVVNRAPIANGIVVTNTPGHVLQIPVAAVTGAGSDPDGNSLSLSSVGPTSTQGFAVIADASFISYQNNANVSDTFEFVITDGRGATASATVQVVPGIVPADVASGPTPSALEVRVGEDATFTVIATGTDPVTYQWRFGDEEIPTANSSSYTRQNAQLEHSGEYSVIVSNAAGFKISAAAVLSVKEPVQTRITSFETLPDGGFHFTATADLGNYAVEATTNFVDWEELTNFVISSDVFDYTDTVTNLDRRGYRIKRLEQPGQ
jgi:autotransporter-associated beta strand protein